MATMIAAITKQRRDCRQPDCLVGDGKQPDAGQQYHRQPIGHALGQHNGSNNGDGRAADIAYHEGPHKFAHFSWRHHHEEADAVDAGALGE